MNDHSHIHHKLINDTITNQYVSSKHDLKNLAFVMAVILLLFTCNSTGVMQTVCATLFGGIISLLITLLSIEINDRQTAKIAKYDLALSDVDFLIQGLRYSIELNSSAKNNYITVESTSIHYQLMFMMKQILNIQANDNIDTHDFMLFGVEDNYVTLKDLYAQYDKIINKELNVNNKHIQDNLIKNWIRLDVALSDLRNSIYRQKQQLLMSRVNN